MIPAGISFDELNSLYNETHADDMRSMPYEEYFGDMDLTEEQKDQRAETAKNIEEFTIYALMSLFFMRQEGAFDYVAVSADMIDEYNALLDRIGGRHTSAFSGFHVQNIVSEIIMATIGHPDDAYFYSEDRARVIAENEANAIWNDSEFAEAVFSGKTQKRWIAIIDRVTRDSHRAVNGTVLPIMEPFVVGDSLMMYPHDSETFGAGAEEIVNCRCSVIYY